MITIRKFINWKVKMTHLFTRRNGPANIVQPLVALIIIEFPLLSLLSYFLYSASTTKAVALIPLSLEPNLARFGFAMEEVTAVFATAYTSKRLVYRDIENTDADKELLHAFGPANHVSWGLISGRMFRDVSKKANFDVLGKLLESDLLLKVLICLPTIPRGEIEELGQLLGARAAKERETATPIGSLTLSAPREGFLQAPTTVVGLCIGEEYQNQVR